MEHSSPESSAHDDHHASSPSAQGGAHHPPSQAAACPVTPRRDTGSNLHSCIVDYNHQPFVVTWWGFLDYPDLTKFPDLADGAAVRPVPLSPTLAAVWADSSPLAFGCCASVRLAQRPSPEALRRRGHPGYSHTRFPVIKLPHPDEPRARDLLEREFGVLRRLGGRGLPVPAVDPRPILDGGRVQGYRMEELQKLERGEYNPPRGASKLVIQLLSKGSTQ